MVVITALLSGVVAGLAVAVPVGAVGALIVMTGAQRGWRLAAAGGAGAATVDAAYAILAVVGGGTAAAMASSAAEPLRVAAGLVLLVLGALMVRSGCKSSGSSADNGPSRLFGSAGRAYASLVGITAVNPATVIYFVALVMGGQVGRGTIPAGAVFVAGVFIGSAAWQLLLAFAGAALGGVLAGPRSRRLTAFIGGGITVLLAIKTLAGWPG